MIKSFTHIATKSWPIPSSLLYFCASATFVPTPSVHATSTGFFISSPSLYIPAKPPIPPRTLLFCVDETSFFIRSIRSLPAEISTPADL